MYEWTAGNRREIERINALTRDEVDRELRALGVEPIKVLSPEVKALIGAAQAKRPHQSILKTLLSPLCFANHNRPFLAHQCVVLLMLGVLSVALIPLGGTETVQVPTGSNLYEIALVTPGPLADPARGRDRDSSGPPNPASATGPKATLKVSYARGSRKAGSRDAANSGQADQVSDTRCAPIKDCAQARHPVPSPVTQWPYRLAGTVELQGYYPNNPANVDHSNINDHLKYRISHSDRDLTHIFSLNGHVWQRPPTTDEGSYLDSTMLSPGINYKLEMVYNGSGNRNKVVGDSIFNCPFYPHFAAGMWAMWRTHNVFESGTELTKRGMPMKGVRNLPDDEIKVETLRTVFTHDHFGPSTHQQASLYAGLLVDHGDPTWTASDDLTPLMRAYQNGDVQLRLLVGAHVFSHQFTLEGPAWTAKPPWKNSDYRSTQPIALSERSELLSKPPWSSAPNTKKQCPDGMLKANCVDYLYSPSIDEGGLGNGLWGLFRSHSPTVEAEPTVSLSLLKSSSIPSKCYKDAPLDTRDCKVVLEAKAVGAGDKPEITWLVSGGRILREGDRVIWDLSNKPADSYSVTAKLRYGNGKETSDTVNVPVERYNSRQERADYAKQ